MDVLQHFLLQSNMTFIILGRVNCKCVAENKYPGGCVPIMCDGLCRHGVTVLDSYSFFPLWFSPWAHAPPPLPAGWTQMVPKGWMYSMWCYYILKDKHNLSIESSSSECEPRLSRAAVCTVLPILSLDMLLHRCHQYAFLHFYFTWQIQWFGFQRVKLHTYGLSSYNVSRLFPPVLWRIACFLSFVRLCFLISKTLCLSRGIKNERGPKTTAQWTRHAKEREKGGGKEREREI